MTKGAFKKKKERRNHFENGVHEQLMTEKLKIKVRFKALGMEVRGREAVSNGND